MLVLCSGMYDGVLHWARISYVMTYDESGLPLRAMLSAEDSTSGQIFLGQQLSVCLAQEGLVARYSADGFLVLFPRADSEAWLRQRIETSIADLRKAYVDKDGIAHPIVLACGYAVEEVSEMRFADDSMSRSIVEGIARACEKNGIRCVAEGVEFPSYIEPLVSMGCRYGQGYCFARPMTVDQFANECLVDASDDAERTIPIPKGDGEE